MTAIDKHDMTVGCTIDDDGVWLECSCGWRKNFGFRPTPAHITAVQGTHLAAVEAQAPGLEETIAAAWKAESMREIKRGMALTGDDVVQVCAAATREWIGTTLAGIAHEMDDDTWSTVYRALMEMGG